MLLQHTVSSSFYFVMELFLPPLECDPVNGDEPSKHPLILMLEGRVLFKVFNFGSSL